MSFIIPFTVAVIVTVFMIVIKYVFNQTGPLWQWIPRLIMNIFFVIFLFTNYSNFITIADVAIFYSFAVGFGIFAIVHILNGVNMTINLASPLFWLSLIPIIIGGLSIYLIDLYKKITAPMTILIPIYMLIMAYDVFMGVSFANVYLAIGYILFLLTDWQVCVNSLVYKYEGHYWLNIITYHATLLFLVYSITIY